MTKQHLIKIAAEFKKVLEHVRGSEHYSDNRASLDAVQITIEGFCDAAEKINPKFDRARFLAACGLNS